MDDRFFESLEQENLAGFERSLVFNFSSFAGLSPQKLNKLAQRAGVELNWEGLLSIFDNCPIYVKCYRGTPHPSLGRLLHKFDTTSWWKAFLDGWGESLQGIDFGAALPLKGLPRGVLVTNSHYAESANYFLRVATGHDDFPVIFATSWDNYLAALKAGGWESRLAFRLND
jgi:hypothetical protein